MSEEARRKNHELAEKGAVTPSRRSSSFLHAPGEGSQPEKKARRLKRRAGDGRGVPAQREQPGSIQPFATSRR